MDIRVKAALYSIGWFAGIFLIGMVLGFLSNYYEPWMGITLLVGFFFCIVYSLMLAKLRFDASITRVVTMDGKSEKE
jgi:hypothetical protein